LEQLIRQSIPAGINPPSTHLPRRLDKLTYSATSHTYADILKKTISSAAPHTETATTNNRPPRKRQATLIDYDLDGSTAITAVPNITNHNTATSTPTSQASSPDYAVELLSLKAEILSLRNIISEAVEQFKSAIASIPTPSPASPHAAMSSAMETDTDQSIATTSEITNMIMDLKHDISTVQLEMRAKFQHLATISPAIQLKGTPVT